MKVLSFFIVPILCLGLPAPAAMGQSQSANYSLAAGAAIGGGGNSFSSGYGLSGGVPLSAGGESGSNSYGLIGGVAAVLVSANGTALYDAAAVEVIPVANRTLEIHYLGAAYASGTFYYRFGGQSSYQAAGMTDTPGSGLTYALSSNLTTYRGLEYYFEVDFYGAISFVGSPGEPYVFVIELNNAQGRRPDAMPDALYRIIGLPIETASHSAEDIFPDDLGPYDITQWRLGSYETALDSVVEYPNVSEVYPGRGFWLISRRGKKYGAPGLSMRPSMDYDGRSYCRVALEQGWNQVANPFAFSISWDDVLFEDNGIVQEGHPTDLLDDAAYWYDGSGYQVVTMIPAWEGFFVFIKKSNASILFPFREAVVPLEVTAEQGYFPINDGWAVRLRLESGGLVDDANLAGVSAGAKSGEDELDYAEPPPPPGGPSLAFLLPGENRIFKRSDIRPPFTDGAIWDIVFKNCRGGRLTVFDLNSIPDSMSAWLEMAGSMMPLSSSDPVPILEGIESARLIVGTEEFLAEKNFDNPQLTFLLEQNYPNPFNPTTIIKFNLPNAVHVKLSVFNVKGEHIITLVDRHMPEGRKEVAWTATDDHGNAMASGIYFYRLVAGDFVQTRKMVLLR